MLKFPNVVNVFWFLEIHTEVFRCEASQSLLSNFQIVQRKNTYTEREKV